MMKNLPSTFANSPSLDKHSIDNNSSLARSADLSRRKFIKLASASVAALSFPGLSTASGTITNKVKHPKKIVWILLRGALDSLHTVIPTFEPQYRVLRPNLATSFKAPVLPLSQGFALHPSLVSLHQWYQDKQLLPVVAVSSGYSRRSHFDGQDFLESGNGKIAYDSGWLARAIDVKNKRALAVARSTPISLRSSEQVYTWYPSKLKNADDDIYQSLLALYQDDELLRSHLISALAVKGVIGKQSNQNNKQQGRFVELSKACAKLITAEQGVDCAMLELGGWDTHSNQANRLSKKLTELDTGLAELKMGLGEEWKNTVVIIGTEFGRTVKENGTLGTDHGTGSAMFLAGGGLNGGKVLGQWPGLADNQLFEQRDLMPTSNSFSWIANVLVQQWNFSNEELLQVFPHLTAYDEKLLVS
ncbi:DUF1501 domain-containing protein [Thalassotalea piscium]